MGDRESHGDVVAIHVGAHPRAPANTALTQGEGERMLDVYPARSPSMVSTPGTRAVRWTHPISETHHENVRRHACVLTVGRSISDGPARSLSCLKQLKQKSSDRWWKDALLMNPFEMVGHAWRPLRDVEKSHHALPMTLTPSCSHVAISSSQHTSVFFLAPDAAPSREKRDGQEVFSQSMRGSPRNYQSLQPRRSNLEIFPCYVRSFKLDAWHARGRAL